MIRPTVARLPTLGVLRFAGPDARRFLQGQLSNDMQLLAADRPLRAGLLNVQGRVIAILGLLTLDADVLAILPRELAERVTQHLTRYILRAKLRIENASDQLAVYGIQEAAGRVLRVQSALAAAPAGDARGEAAWQAADVADGLPQIHAATSERFTAQMVNLDRIDGISFTKGCYTGQEIVARAHYRGRVKRRMQRFVTGDATALAPGDRIQLVGGAIAEVVEVARTAAGAQDFLAVAPLPGTGRDTVAEDSALPRIAVASAPLPYTLEDVDGRPTP